MIDHDRLFKELLSNFFPDFIELFFPELSQEWERDSIRFLPQEIFTDITEGKKKIIDLIVEASFKNHKGLFIIHTEHQSYSQTGFNKRMFTYFALLHEKYGLPIYPIVIYSHNSPKKMEPHSYRIEFWGKSILEFNYEVIQLNQLQWQDFINQRNPIASALMAKMQMKKEERPQVKLLSLQLLANLGLNPAQVQLISGFIDTYLKLNDQEQAVFTEQLASIEPEKQEGVMQIVTSWMEQGLEQGREQGKQQEAISLISRLLNRRVGSLTPQLQQRLQDLSTTELEDLGEALLDFTAIADLDAWFEAKTPIH